MPDLDFQVTGVEAANRGLSPLLQFKVRIAAQSETETIQAVILNAQIQFQSAQRHYNDSEKEKIVELFGTPDRWGHTLRNKLWTNAGTSVSQFTGNTTAILPVPCTFDLNIAATKYFYALEEGEVPLLFLFSGTVFHSTPEGRLHVERISWNKECTYNMPLRAWEEMMRQHYHDTAWISLQGDVFDRIYAYKRRMGLTSWEDTIRRLLADTEKPELTTKHEPAVG